MTSQRDQWAWKNQNINGKLNFLKLSRDSWVLKPGLFFAKFISPKFHHFRWLHLCRLYKLPPCLAFVAASYCYLHLLLHQVCLFPTKHSFHCLSKPKNACSYHCQIWIPAAPLSHLFPHFLFAQPNWPSLSFSTYMHTHHLVLSIHAGLCQRLSCSIPGKYPALPMLPSIFFSCLIFSHLVLFYHLL